MFHFLLLLLLLLPSVSSSNVSLTDWDLSWRSGSSESSPPCKTLQPSSIVTDVQTCHNLFPGASSQWTYGENFFTYANYITENEFTYSTEIDKLPPSSSDYVITFSSVKSGARLYVNDVVVETFSNQFLSYNVSLPSGTSSVRLKLVFDGSIDTKGRYMACSGGWDWGPYTQTYDAGDRPVFDYGILGDVVLHYDMPTTVVTQVTLLTEYRGEHVLKYSDIVDDFVLTVKALLSQPYDAPTAVTLKLTADYVTDGDAAAVMVKTAGLDEWEVVFEVPVSRSRVNLWYPNGMGEQVLYSTKVVLMDENGATLHDQVKNVGFKTISLVTTDDTQIVNDARRGNADHTMLFRVNGNIVVCRGSNVIPPSQIGSEIQNSSSNLLQMIISSADANMNMVRVWGGGTPLPRQFYDACDEYGILVYQDVFLVEEHNHGPMSPDGKTVVVDEREISSLVREVANHVSVVVFDGCNECTVVTGTSTGIYGSLVMRVVGEIVQQSVPIWPSCPGKGWDTGVFLSNSTYSNEPLTAGTVKKNTIEVHGPYYHGGSATNQQVNGLLEESDAGYIYDTMLPVEYSKTSTGIEEPGVFVSEFGASVYSSFESMSVTMPKDQWSIHAVGGINGTVDTCVNKIGNENTCTTKNAWTQRNYPCDSHIKNYFGEYPESWWEVSEYNLKRQLYHCMLSQAMIIKSNIELMRSQNIFGILTWQLNENWPSGGWGSLEFAVGSYGGEGGILGGRWKVLHHWFKQHLYTDVTGSCGSAPGIFGDESLCYIRNDGMYKWTGSFCVDVVEMASGSTAPSPRRVFTAQIAVSPGEIVWFEVEALESIDKKTEFAMVKALPTGSGTADFFNPVLFTPPKNFVMNLPPTKLEVMVVDSDTVSVKEVNGRLAMFVVLTCNAQGRFSENGFVLLPGQVKYVDFVHFFEKQEGERRTVEGEKETEARMLLLQSSIRAEDLYLYSQGDPDVDGG